MSSSAFTRRLSEFKEKFGRMLGAKAQGYDELSTLERPLVADDHQESDEYQQRHGVPKQQHGSSYRPPQVGGAHGEQHAGDLQAPAQLPSQADEMLEISVLARDAAEILWEMVAMGEHGSAMADMQSKAEQLQAQLRGLINDWQGGDEGVYAKAFEAFDMLSRCLEELQNPAKPAPVPAAPGPVPVLAPPPTGAPAPAAALPTAAAAGPAEADLISF